MNENTLSTITSWEDGTALAYTTGGALVAVEDGECRRVSLRESVEFWADHVTAAHVSDLGYEGFDEMALAVWLREVSKAIPKDFASSRN